MERDLLLRDCRTVKNYIVTMYRKLGNFHVEIIHVVNIHVDLFSWVYDTHKNILT